MNDGVYVNGTICLKIAYVFK